MAIDRGRGGARTRPRVHRGVGARLAPALRRPLSSSDLEHLDEHRVARRASCPTKALALDPELGGAYAALGTILHDEERLGGRGSSASKRPCNRNVPAADMGGYALLQLYAGKFEPVRARHFRGRRARPRRQAETIHRFLAFLHCGTRRVGNERTSCTSLAHAPIRRRRPERCPECSIRRCTGWSGATSSRKHARMPRSKDPLNAAMLERLGCDRGAGARDSSAARIEATVRRQPQPPSRHRPLGRSLRRRGPGARRDARRQSTSRT